MSYTRLLLGTPNDGFEIAEIAPAHVPDTPCRRRIVLRSYPLYCSIDSSHIHKLLIHTLLSSNGVHSHFRAFDMVWNVKKPSLSRFRQTQICRLSQRWT